MENRFTQLRRSLLLTVVLTAGSLAARAQGVGIGTSAPDASAVLDVTSTTKGLLLPRLTAAQRTLIASPAEGLLVSQTNLVKGPYYFDGSAWVNLITGTTGPATDNAGASTVLSGQTDAGGTDGNSGSAAAFSSPTGVAFDGSGNLFVVDQYNHALRAIALGTGAVTTVAGGSYGNVDATGPAAKFNYPVHLGVGGGTVYITDNGNYSVRKVVLSTQAVTTVSFASGGYPSNGAAVDASGNLYLASGSAILKIAAGTGTMTTVAGSLATRGYLDGTGAAARLNVPTGIALDGTGNLYVADYLNHRIRKVVLATGVVTTVAGSGAAAFTNATGTAASFNYPYDVALDGSGNLYVADQYNNAVRKIVLASGAVTTLAGGFSPAYSVSGVAADASGNVYVADVGNSMIRKIVVSTGVVSTLAGYVPGFSDGQAVVARFNGPKGVAMNAAGVTFVADAGNHTIRQISSVGVVSTLAGTAGTAGTADATGAAARFNTPTGVALDAGGNMYVADAGNHTIRKITTGGVVTTLAGTAGAAGTTNATGAAARFSGPTGVAVDAAGNVYVADAGNHTIRKITAAGVVTTLAGTAGTAGAANGPGTTATFSTPLGVAVNAAGTVYVADAGNHQVRKVTAGGVVSTLAGAAGGGYADGGATTAAFNTPTGVALDANGALYIADQNNHRIREISPTTGATTTLAGNGSAAYLEGTGTGAAFAAPYGLTVSPAGTVHVADTGNNRVRKLQ